MKITNIKKYQLNSFEKWQIEELSGTLQISVKESFTEKDIAILNYMHGKEPVYFEYQVKDVVSLCERFSMYIAKQMAVIVNDTNCPPTVCDHILDNYKLQLKSCETLKKIFTQPDIDSDEE